MRFLGGARGGALVFEVLCLNSLIVRWRESIVISAGLVVLDKDSEENRGMTMIPAVSWVQGVKVWGLPAVLGSQEVSSQGGSWEVCCLCVSVGVGGVGQRRGAWSDRKPGVGESMLYLGTVRSLPAVGACGDVCSITPSYHSVPY